MKNQQILEFLKEQKDEITKRLGVRRIGLFGSHIRGESTARSDVEILIEMDRLNFDNYMDLKFYLEENLERSVDLVLADSVKTHLKPFITSEVIYA